MCLSVKFTAPFTNMRTLKFKIQLTVEFFTAVNHRSGSLEKQRSRVQRGQKVTFTCFDWWISIFHGLLVADL